jgi:hypothetical protein
MTRRIFLLPMVFAVLGLLNTAAFALPPIGPPGNVLSKGQWAFDLVYGHSNMDLDAEGKCRDHANITMQVNGNTVDEIDVYEPPRDESAKVKVSIDNLKSNMVFSSIGYGVAKNWDVYVRLGGIDAEFDMDSAASIEGNWGFGYGFGTRATFMQEGKISVGGLFQVTFANSNAEAALGGELQYEESTVTTDITTNLLGHGELDWYEMQLAIGATYQTDNAAIYGGPFLYFLDGDLELKGSGEADMSWSEGSTEYDESISISKTYSLDVEQGSEFGGFVGAKWDMDERSLMYIEGQFTGDGWGAFVGGIFGFP